MKIFLNCILFCLIALTATSNNLLIAFFLVVIFTFRVGAVWLIPLSIFIDGYFGAFYAIPMFTIFSIAWYGISEFVRPQLLMQYKRYEEAA
jgi:hypothetical protein